MVGLVEQLQLDAIDPSVPVSSLLRKAKVAAAKLGLEDALTWVESELSGYRSAKALPDYRRGSGETVGFDPYQGWLPIHFTDPKTATLISAVALYEPVASYEALLAQGNGPFRLALPPEMISLINETFSFDVPRVANNVPRGFIFNVVQQVRDRVLNWSLELERAGINGRGLGFTVDEQKKASVSHISIGTFNGSFSNGDASGDNARINQGSTDNSRNFAAENSVFSEMDQVIRENISDRACRSALLEASRDMQQASNSADLLSAYNRFISAAANHMTVVAPFLPALANLIVS